MIGHTNASKSPRSHGLRIFVAISLILVNLLALLCLLIYDSAAGR